MNIDKNGLKVGPKPSLKLIYNEGTRNNIKP